MKIFITGCAKTGTTLVRRLFNAFDLKVYNGGEISLENLLASGDNVGKRTSMSILSNILSPQQKKRYVKIIESNNVKIINVVRNKVDTLKSTGGYVSEQRYNACMKQKKELNDIITYIVDYDKLIIEPNKIQEEISNLLGLTIIHKWSDYPNFINIEEESPDLQQSDRYSLRKIGKNY
jgi:hypothetical protein